ncbi:AbrB family transcriptional regulator [Paenibacillus daejeonensis]|uniref:AbrB family transcriptional regulator n=1 Tax=Paenibacillus daejeonensis TaxID=135193 RepID=UPI0003A19072|nr:AbrB family transcriptional regulator [Paenibacillus daejeonensis]
MQQSLLRTLLTAAIAVCGGLLFQYLHIPVPWLLGPMSSVFVASLLIRSEQARPHWLPSLRNTGMIIVGYAIGLSFTREALIQIVRQLPTMIVLSILLMGLCMLLALLSMRLARIDLPTAMLSSVPGGLSQMVTLAEEMRGVNLTTVTVFQVVRVLLIVLLVPLLVVSPLFSTAAGGGSELPGAVPVGLSPVLGLFILCGVLMIALGLRIRMPNAYMVGPILSTALLVQLGVAGPEPSTPVLQIAQLLIGVYVGLLLKPSQAQKKLRLLLTAILTSLLLIGGSLGLSEVVGMMHGLDHITGFLAMAPGGMDQMSIIAHEVDADLSIVSAYQLFRLFFVFFVISPLLQLLFRRVYGSRMKSS